MLDIRQIAHAPDEWRRRLARRGAAEGLDEALRTDARRRELIQRADQLRHDKSETEKAMRTADKQGPEFAEFRDRMRSVGAEVKSVANEQKEVEARLADLMLTIPNAPDDVIPDGKTDADNKVLRKWGEPRALDFEARAHWDIAEAHGWLDMEAGAKVAGARFPVYRGPLARLERALCNLMLDLHTTQHGYTEILPPFMVNEASMQGTGQFPKFRTDAFLVAAEDDGELKAQNLVLVPTAEVPLTNLHRDEILDAGALPVQYTAFTPCFRREAGGYGRDTRGLIRVHQFQKVELVHIVRPEESEAALETLIGNAEAVLQALELPYQVVDLCAGDVSFASRRTYDLEVWLPGQAEYREISSCSNCGDYQARRAKIRYRPAPGEKARLAHTLNGSGLALGRTVVAVLENGQQADGTVKLPAALVPYMGGLTSIPA